MGIKGNIDFLKNWRHKVQFGIPNFDPVKFFVLNAKHVFHIAKC